MRNLSSRSVSTRVPTDRATTITGHDTDMAIDNNPILYHTYVLPNQ